jgi:uncharacterized protein (TIGR00255 family)
MTGYGRGEASDGVRTVTAEIRAVNHRYGEFSVKLPRRYAFAEDGVRQTVRARIARGKVDVTISVFSSVDEESAVVVNTAAARQYFKGLRALQKDFDVTGGITIELLANLPDVMKASASALDEAAILQVVNAATRAAADNLDAMRVAEGAKLAEDLSARAGVIEVILAVIEERSSALPALYAERLRDRVSEILNKGGVDVPGVLDSEAFHERIALEAAVFADKSNITEEIVRLRSHLGQLRSLLYGEDQGRPVGKKLDFLVQEMNRETNTIGSKANDLKVTQQMLDIKSEVEKIREQVQNVE